MSGVGTEFDLLQGACCKVLACSALSMRIRPSGAKIALLPG